MGRVVHFEIAADDVASSTNKYLGTFRRSNLSGKENSYGTTTRRR